MQKGIVTARGYQNLISGHPWIMASDLENPGQFGSRPSLVQLGEHWFLHSPASAIRLRRFGPLEREWMFAEARAALGANVTSLTDPGVFKKIFGGWLTEHFARLFAFKKQLVVEHEEDLILRWIFSENDLIPGLTVDIFGDVAVAEINFAPIETFWFPMREALEQTLKPLGIRLIEGRDNQIRKKEGLEVIASEGTITPRWMKWNGFEVFVEPGGSQKTGMYLDQKFNHRAAALWAQKLQLQTSYDVFCFQGGFGLHLAKAGLQVTAVDQSAGALATAQKNAEKNNLGAQMKFVEADAFAWLKNLAPQSAELIVHDPPALGAGKDRIENAKRALAHMHVDALKALKPGGLLVTCTCSQAFTDDVLTKILREAGQQARRTLSILEKRGPSPDHPVLPNFPEGDYLHAWYVRV
jgi:23S rRNA (cytosine1962-C5)-methyltransferase